MPKPIQSKPTLAINRRQLLATVAAISTSGILLKSECAAAGQIAEVVMVPTTPVSEAAPLNVCAARNKIRQEACLPLLSIPQELRRMKEVDTAAKFEAFARVHRDTIWSEVLTARRETTGDPNWRPSSWMDGLGLQARVNKVLHQRFVQVGAAKASTA
jgi:hypothetical protein